MTISDITVTYFTNRLQRLYQILGIKISITGTTKKLFANRLQNTQHQNQSIKTD